MKNKIFVFAYNEDSGPHPKYRGYFDGESFVPKTGFCQSIDELINYDFIELYGMDGLLSHTPKRYCSNVLELMKRTFAREYGEVQQGSLLD
ncbi:hypothetical protein PB1_16309 [Bacillus methanolicus PB1]|uniref:Uncharacterized protein n=1 Tax=Bacillus methanolicus PB1 TaxID=997296 RepID=I3DY16_BACMT|nr:hypothetical protein [Bacillus methanolicus]EIJ79137.1 hypothetical protein PB1_16309 [Bacillus methanolicus PB1]